jgi:hypothetical protein
MYAMPRTVLTFRILVDPTLVLDLGFEVIDVLVDSRELDAAVQASHLALRESEMSGLRSMAIQARASSATRTIL